MLEEMSGGRTPYPYFSKSIPAWRSGKIAESAEIQSADKIQKQFGAVKWPPGRTPIKADGTNYGTFRNKMGPRGGTFARTVVACVMVSDGITRRECQSEDAWNAYVDHMLHD